MTASLALTGARLFTGEAFHDGKTLVIADGVIKDITNTPPSGAEVVVLPADHVLAPGFIDIQVNGGGGVLFNDTPDVATIGRIGAAHRRFGTTGFLPTLISDTPDKLPLALAAARNAIAQVPGALGIHVEGPFIAAARRGVHAAAVLRAMSADERRLLVAPIGGVTLVTVAPEIVPPADIAALNQAGVRVFLGHSDAAAEAVEAALAAGACGFTHLFNAMSGFTGRAPGMVGAALADRASWCGLIVDRHHVAAASLRAALAAKPRGKCVLVTDAMPPVGAASPEFLLYGETLTVKDGRLVTASGTLAGSALDMAGAVCNCVAWLGVPLDEALRMASAYPADALGLGHTLGRLEPGYRADVVALDAKLQVTRTWIGGQAARHDG
jgi:N-acetylglucosamine-6-phosphate deacetylase